MPACANTRACAAFQSALSPLIVFFLFCFFAVVKEQKVRGADVSGKRHTSTKLHMPIYFSEQTPD